MEVVWFCFVDEGDDDDDDGDDDGALVLLLPEPPRRVSLLSNELKTSAAVFATASSSNIGNILCLTTDH